MESRRNILRSNYGTKTTRFFNKVQNYVALISMHIRMALCRKPFVPEFSVTFAWYIFHENPALAGRLVATTGNISILHAL